MTPIPVYDEGGETLVAPSVRGAAAALDTTETTLRQYLELHRDGWRLIGRPQARRRRVPVYDEAGVKIADSIADAAAALGVPAHLLRPRLSAYTDGVQVGPAPGLPPNWVRIVLPDGRSWDSARAAARAIGCQPKALWAIAKEPGSRREGQTIYLVRAPERAGQAGGARGRHPRTGTRPPCEMPGCGKPSVGRNLCRTHYNRWWMRNAVRNRGARSA